MRRWRWAAAGVALAWLLWPAAAQASCSGYRSGGDVTLRVSSGLSGSTWSSALSLLALGQAAYAQQESVHEAACSTTGTSISHSYIWVEVDGYQVLAVDPPTVLYNGGNMN